MWKQIKCVKEFKGLWGCLRSSPGFGFGHLSVMPWWNSRGRHCEAQSPRLHLPQCPPLFHPTVHKHATSANMHCIKKSNVQGGTCPNLLPHPIYNIQHCILHSCNNLFFLSQEHLKVERVPSWNRWGLPMVLATQKMTGETSPSWFTRTSSRILKFWFKPWRSLKSHLWMTTT